VRQAMRRFECVLVDRYGAAVRRENIVAKTRKEAVCWAYGWALSVGHLGAFDILKDGKRIDAFRPR
jgi:hypothetical protein